MLTNIKKTSIFLAIALLLTGVSGAVAKPSKQKTKKIQPRVMQSKNDSTILTFDIEYQPSNDVIAPPQQGVIKVYLYPDNNLKEIRRNFKQLVDARVYDRLLFHRVIPNFMIQGGDPKSKNAASGELLGDGGAQGQGIGPMPFVPGQLYANPPRYHKYGAVAIARTGDDHNLERMGSSSQFYIVTSDQRYKPQQIGAMAADRRYKYMNVLAQFAGSQENAMRLFSSLYANQAGNIPDEVADAYRTVGGTPFLDEDYTVIGEVIEGMDVAKAIENLPRDNADRPLGFARIVKVTYSGPEVSTTEAAEALKNIKKKK